MDKSETPKMLADVSNAICVMVVVLLKRVIGQSRGAIEPNTSLRGSDPQACRPRDCTACAARATFTKRLASGDRRDDGAAQRKAGAGLAHQSRYPSRHGGRSSGDEDHLS